MNLGIKEDLYQVLLEWIRKIWLDYPSQIFQTHRLIAIEYDYIHYKNKILKGKIVFWKDLNACYKSFGNACNNDDEISKNGKRKEGF